MPVGDGLLFTTHAVVTRSSIEGRSGAILAIIRHIACDCSSLTRCFVRGRSGACFFQRGPRGERSCEGKALEDGGRGHRMRSLCGLIRSMVNGEENVAMKKVGSVFARLGIGGFSACARPGRAHAGGARLRFCDPHGQFQLGCR